VGVGDHGHLGVRHVLPALQRFVIEVADRSEHGADVEGLLAARVGPLVEHLADRREVEALDPVGVAADVSLPVVGGRRWAGEPLAGRDVAVLVVREQHLDALARSGAQCCACPLGPMTRS
jgi:hypothetical protein